MYRMLQAVEKEPTAAENELNERLQENDKSTNGLVITIQKQKYVEYFKIYCCPLEKTKIFTKID